MERNAAALLETAAHALTRLKSDGELQTPTFSRLMNRIRAWSNRENFSYRFWTFVRLLNGGSGGLRVGPRGEHSGRESTSSEEEHFVIAGVPLYKPFQMTSRPPSWCPKLIVLKELNSFLSWTLSFVAINLNRWRLSKWKYPIPPRILVELCF